MNGTRETSCVVVESSGGGDVASEIRHSRLIDQSSGTGNTTDDNTATTTLNSSSNASHRLATMGDTGLTAAGVASVAQAALSAAKAEKAAAKPKIAYEVRPFTKESLEKINLRTSNLIRDYGFLPKRKPNLMDGAELPAKYEPFPPELLGKPVEEIDQYVYEKVNSTHKLSCFKVIRYEAKKQRGGKQLHIQLTYHQGLIFL